MENIVNNPGLQHLAEKVFFNLNVEKLKICKQINQPKKHNAGASSAKPNKKRAKKS